MSLAAFCCPVCKGPLDRTAAGLRCAPCDRAYPIVDGIPDLFVSEGIDDYIDEPNKTWLDPEIVEVRDTIYRLSVRELRGMEFCMREIGRRTYAGCRILEVGMGTGHFTRWIAEVSEPGTEIYAFDLSWPIIEIAKGHTRGMPGITLFRANARGRLPFAEEYFDIVFLRLAPLGAHGVPNVRAGYDLLRPGGWYFEAGWIPARFETPPTEWAIQHGYGSAEHHVWQYWRVQTAQEYAANQIHRERLISQGYQPSPDAQEAAAKIRLNVDGSVTAMTHENLTIAHKPSPA